MCGIVGILSRDLNEFVDQGLIREMNGRMFHRGPDESGTYFMGNIGLGHRRLSIIDVKSGHQPMTDPESGKVIVYNGEVYNFKDLRGELASRGHRFTTNCDTEVVMKLADFDHFDWVERLNGMFALALWSERARVLLLVRDRLGVKPLYWCDTGRQIIFASEIKPLLSHPSVRTQINERKVPEFLAFRHLAGEETLFRGIRKMTPGTVLRWRPPYYKMECIRFWREGKDASARDPVDKRAPLADQFLSLFRDSVERRLVSDVPVGTYNSGGVDSSLVTAVVRGLKRDDLHTFSVGFEERNCDETAYSDVVSKKYRTIHHSLVVDSRQFAAELPRTIWFHEEPITHPHTVQIRLLSRLAKQYVTVVLTGEGADEVFGGYPRYNLLKVHPFISPLLRGRTAALESAASRCGFRRVLKLLDSSSMSAEEAILHNSRFTPLADIGRAMNYEGNLDVRKGLCAGAGSLLERVLYYDQRTYLSSLLNRLDKMSMAASIEGRVPFLDYRLVEWSYKLDPRLKIRGWTNKWLVKKAAERYLPREIVYRKKFGFDVPVAAWLRSEDGLGRYLALLTDTAFKRRQYFNPRGIAELIHEHRRGADHTEVLWGLVNFELWCRTFFEPEEIPDVTLVQKPF